MDLHLTDDQAALLLKVLDRVIDDDRFPLSPRVTALREIRALVKPYPERQPTEPPKYYDPPSRGRWRRRR
jgi:hypothetical protein